MRRLSRKTLSLVLVVIMILSVASGIGALAAREYAADVSILGATVDLKNPAYAEENRIFVPLEELGGYMNISVERQGNAITVQRGSTTAVVTVGNMICTVDGAEVTLSYQPVEKNGVVYVPVDFFSTAFSLPVSVSEDFRSADITPNTYKVAITENDAAGVKASLPDEDTLVDTATGNDQLFWNQENFPGMLTAVYYKADLSRFKDKEIESASLWVTLARISSYNPSVTIIRTAPWEKGNISFNNRPEEFAETASIALPNSSAAAKAYVNREADVTAHAKAAMAEGTSLYVKLNGTPHKSKVTDDAICANAMGVNTTSAPYLLVKVKENYSFPVKTVETEETEEEFSYSKMALLRSLGVFTENDEFPLDLTEGVQRQEFVKYALRMRNTQPASGDGTQFFSDVPTDAPFYNDVMTAHSLGLVVGWEGIAFRPYDEITIGEAITIMGRMLNYNIYADERGGFTPGYFSAAVQGDLYRGTTSETQKLSFKTMFTLLEDALDAKMLNVRSYSSNGTAEYIFDENMTILTEYWNAEVIEGTVTANEYTSLAGGSGNEGSIEINSKKLLLSFKPYNDFLGYRVKAYYEKYEEKLLYMGIKEYDITEIDISDITSKSKSGNTISFNYEKENGSIGKESFSFEKDKKHIIYNGKSVTEAEFNKKGVSLLDGDGGSIKLVGDSLAVITAYKTLVVSSVNVAEEEIYDLYDAYERSLKLKSTEYTFTDIEGKELLPEELEKNDVISVAQSLDKELVTAIVSKTKITGSIETAENSGSDDAVYTIGGKEYEICNTAKAQGKADYWTDDLEVGFSTTFFLNHEGRIAGTSVKKTEGIIGYLLTMGYKGSSLNKKLQAAVVIKDAEEYVIYDLADKVEIDCRKFTKHGDIETYFTENEAIKKQPIIFDLNQEGKIKKINTPTRGMENGNYVENEDENLVQIFNSTDTALTSKGNGIYGGIFFVGQGDSLLIAKTGEELEDYSVITALKNDDKPTVDAWAVGKNSPDAVVTLWNGTSDPVVGDDALLYVVDRVVTAFDSDGMEIKKLYYYAGVDSRKSVVVDTKYESVIDGFKRGDIIRFSINARGQLNAADRYYDYGNETAPMLSRSGNYNGGTRVSGGYVGRIEKTFVQLVDYDAADIGNPQKEKREDISDYEYTWHDGSRFANLMSYEVTSSGITVKKETLDSIRTYENVPYDPQGLIMNASYENFRKNVWLVDMPQPMKGTGSYTLTYNLGERGASYGKVPNTPVRCDANGNVVVTEEVPAGKKDAVNGIKYDFTHWEDEDGNTVSSGTITLTKDTVLTAQWEEVPFTYSIYLKEKEEDTQVKATFDATNTNGVYTIPVPGIKDSSGTFHFTKESEGYYNWIDGEGTEYAPGDSLTLTEDLTLYPNWKPITDEEFDISKFTVLRITENEGTQTAASQSTGATISVNTNVWLLVKVAVGKNWKMDAAAMKLKTVTGGNKASDSNGYYVPTTKEAWDDASDGTIASPLTKPSAETEKVLIRSANGTGSFSEVAKEVSFAAAACSSSYDGENLYFAIEFENAGVGKSRWAKWKLTISGPKGN